MIDAFNRCNSLAVAFREKFAAFFFLAPAEFMPPPPLSLSSLISTHNPYHRRQEAQRLESEEAQRQKQKQRYKHRNELKQKHEELLGSAKSEPIEIMDDEDDGFLRRG